MVQQSRSSKTDLNLDSQVKQNLIKVMLAFILSFRKPQMKDICQSDIIETVLFNLAI